ncbi:MAG: aldo/keto reductase [Candidatus Brachytrichaceae bacterium NZ_4S206]|jgi:predicted dehydrogenase/aryl-alcohol dehydrogenase-like predicted oxidoreductase
MTLRWGILSTGNIAKTFAAGVRRSSTGSLVAVASRSQASADQFGDEFDIPKRHANYEALLADPDVDAVYIATPHPLHAEWAIKAAEAGKHILCEKPLALNYPQAQAVVEAAREHDVFLMEAFMYRCHPQTAKLVELIRQGVIGEVRMIQAAFGFHAHVGPEHRLLSNALGGGGILDVGCYPVSMARLIAGVALGRDFAEPVKVHGAGKLNPTTGVDEYAVGTLEFEGGIVAQVATGVMLNMRNVVHIFGTEGDILLTSPWIPARHGGVTDIIVQRHGEPKQIVEVECDEWLYAIEADTVAHNIARRQAPPPAMSWDDTLGNMRALDQWRQAIGLTYEQEKPDAPEMKTTVSRRPLARRSDHRMPYGRIAGVDKPISRLVLGVDNQENIAYASVMFDAFFERGGNAFDTAFIYGGGKHETLLGQWIRNRGIREEVVILDKGAHTPFCTPENLNRHFAISLERLQTDYVDIYMLHRDNPQVPVGEFVEALNEHYRAGRMRAFGGSNWTIERIEAANAYAAAHGLQGFSAISNNFSLARMVEPPWEGCLSASTPEFRDWLTRTQTPLFPWSSQARGFFLDDTAPDFKADPERVRCWFSDDNFERLRRARELAKKYGVLPINIALAYVLHQPFPTFPLIGPRTLYELRTSLPALDVTLTPDEVKWLNLEA